MPESTLISLLCLNRLPATIACLEALVKNTPKMAYQLVITDNHSNDGTHDWLNEWSKMRSNVMLYHEPENTGFIWPNNRAFNLARQFGHKYFVALNNDTVPPEGWLDLLQQPLEDDPAGAISGVAEGCCVLDDNFDGLPSEDRYEYAEGSCLCAKINLVETLLPKGKLFDETNLDFIYGEDSDLSLRAQEAGFNVHKSKLVLPHTRGETVTTQPEVEQRCLQAKEKNHQYLRTRWADWLKTRKFA